MGEDRKTKSDFELGVYILFDCKGDEKHLLW